MKKLVKVGLFIVPIVITISFYSWLLANTILPALEDADLKVTDLFSSPSEVNIAVFEKKTIENSHKLGETVSKYVIVNILKPFVDSVTIDTVSMPESEYPFPSMEDVLELCNEAAAEGLEEGLNQAEEIVKSNDKIRNEILNNSVE